MFEYGPAEATPLIVHVMLPLTASVVEGQVTAPRLLSVTATDDNAMLPLLVTTYVHVTCEPVGTISPVPASLSTPLVLVMMPIAGAAPK